MPKSNSVHVHKPKLVPVKVPWKVCSSTSFLSLTVGEDSGDCPTELSFVAFDLTEKVDRSIFREVSPEDMMAYANANPDPRDKVVKVTFEISGCARMIPGNEGNVPSNYDPSKFDLSEIPFRDDPDTSEPDLEACDERYALKEETWLTTGICPDPCMYEVKNSPWLRELHTKRLYLGREDLVFHHYLIQGHSKQVEVIASGWRWEFVNLE